MKKLTSAETLVLINHYANLLAAEGIRTEVRNQHLGSVMGEIPFFETWRSCGSSTTLTSIAPNN